MKVSALPRFSLIKITMNNELRVVNFQQGIATIFLPERNCNHASRSKEIRVAIRDK